MVGHRLVAGLADAPVAELGETSVAAALSTLLRISKSEAHRRIREAADLAPRRALTGEVLEPLLPCTAAAQARGQIGAEHVRIIRRFFDHLPSFVTYDEREAAEAQLASLACGLKPEELRVAADRLAMLLDQDGELTDGDRARRRYLIIGAQQPDGMSEVSRPARRREARAVIDAVFAKASRPGHVQSRRRGAVCGRRSVGRGGGLPIPGRPGSVTMTRSRRWVGRCWRRDSWVVTTGCR